MPVYSVQGPDGRVYEVEGPPNATAEQLGAFITSQQSTSPVQAQQPQGRQQPIATQQAIRQQAQMGGPARFAMGVARPVLETAYGIKELAGGELTPEQRHQLEVLRANKGAAGTTGRIAGEVATFAAPGGVIGKGVSMLPRGANAARLAGDIAVTAGMESLKAPTDERSRLDAAKEGAAGAVLGHGIGAAAAPLVRGVKNVTDDAREFMRQHPDVVPTLGQMKGGAVKAIEERLKAVPFVGQQIQKREREALEQWNRDLANRAIPSGGGTLPKSVRTGQESVAEVQDRFGEAYDEIFKDKTFDLDGLKPQLAWADQTATQYLPDDAAKRVSARVKQLYSEVSDKTPGVGASRIDDQLRTFAKDARQTGYSDEAAVYDQLREQFRGLLGPETTGRLREVDAAYRQWIPIERAAAYKGAGANEGIFTPSQLLGASRASSDTVRKRGFAAGNAPQQQEAQLAGRVLGNELPQPGPGTAEKLLGVGAFLNPSVAAPFAPALVPYSGWGAKALAGKYPWQGKMKSLSEILAEGGVTRATTGGAVEE